MSNSPGAQKSRRVLVVYGRNRQAKDAMFTFLRSIDLSPQEWTTLRAATGKTSPYIGEILKAGFDSAQAVVVLSTPDDVAYLRPEFAENQDDSATRPMGQARPNVLFEAGMAIAWDEDRTVLVEFGHVRGLSDLSGRHVVRMDNTSNARLELVQRLRTAGLAVDERDGAWLNAGDFTVPDNPVDTSQQAPTSSSPGDDPSVVKEGSLTLRPGKPRQGAFGGVELNVRVSNDSEGQNYTGIVVRATFLRDGEAVGAATGTIMNLAPGGSKFAELSGQDQIGDDTEVVLQIDSAF